MELRGNKAKLPSAGDYTR